MFLIWNAINDPLFGYFQVRKYALGFLGFGGFFCHGLYVHCLVSNCEGLGTSLYIMELATIDPHSQKEHIEIHKIPKFGDNQASFD